ncbi:MAG: hypothetical protein HYZ23_06945, partial [Chloroflexi bacterium]|nr:hypothetical protein [Chloroflexota bacterium]
MMPENDSKFENELQVVLHACNETGVLIRVLGSMAFQIHCPHYAHLHAASGRITTDLDFGSYGKHSKAIRETMLKLGYEEKREIFVLSGGERAFFTKRESGVLVDVFYDNLDFSHTIT